MIMGRLKEQENQVNEKLAMAETKKKEIENRIDQEKKKQTDDAKKKAEDAIKGLFRK
jgi:predicted phage-related endonuclease